MKRLWFVFLLGVFSAKAVAFGMLPPPQGVQIKLTEESHIQPVQTILAEAVQQGSVLEYRQATQDSNTVICAFFVDRASNKIVSRKLLKYFGSETKNYVKYIWKKGKIKELCGTAKQV